MAAAPQVYLCHICDKTFSTRIQCTEHTKSHYPSQVSPSGSAERSTNSPTSTTDDKEKKKELEPTDVVPSLKNFSDEEILAKLLERNYAFVCKCGIIFRDQSLFYLHRGTHSAKNPYECSFCGHVAPDWNDFMSHFYVHTNPKEK